MSKGCFWTSKRLVAFASLVSPILTAWMPQKNPGPLNKSASSSIVSLIETNPADLLHRRYRLAHENLIFESTSFSLTGELQDNLSVGDFEEKSIAAGFGLQYYPQSVSLQGFFVRGETDLALASISDSGTQESSLVAALRLAGDVGWRVRISDRLTGSAAYGLRTTIPQALWSNRPMMSTAWISQRSASSDVRVQINLGLLL